jgi:hypothetical protein
VLLGRSPRRAFAFAAPLQPEQHRRPRHHNGEEHKDDDDEKRLGQ